MKYCFVTNGRPGREYIAEDVQKQIDRLEQPLEYEIYRTQCAQDATAYVAEYCRKNPDEETCFVACGGDGTINEVASALVGQTGKCFASMVYGSGNDFVKYYAGRNFQSVKALVEGEAPAAIDILKVNDRYSVNVCNFGFDSIVASVANRRSARGQRAPYRWGVATAILCGRFNRINVVADGERLSRRRMLLCTLANNHYVGGEFFCAPRAKNDDGLIDVCLVHTMPLLCFLGLLPVYTRGEHLDNPKMARRLAWRQVRHVEVSSPKVIELCLDGEMYPGTSFRIDVLPGAVRFKAPAMA